jgi:hypothetical protein
LSLPGLFVDTLAYRIPPLVQMTRHLTAAASGLFLHNLDAYARPYVPLVGLREIMEREIVCAPGKFAGHELECEAVLHGLGQT